MYVLVFWHTMVQTINLLWLKNNLSNLFLAIGKYFFIKSHRRGIILNNFYHFLENNEMYWLICKV